MIYFHFESKNRRKDFGYVETDPALIMRREVASATHKWFELVQTQLPPTTYAKNGVTIPYNFVNTRSCRYFGNSMQAMLGAGVKTNRENEDMGEQAQVTPKMILKRHAMRGHKASEDMLRKAEERNRVASQIPKIFARNLRASDLAETNERDGMKPSELRTNMLAVVRKSVADIMKEGATDSNFDVTTFVASNAWTTNADLEQEAAYMEAMEENNDPDQQEDTVASNGGGSNAEAAADTTGDNAGESEDADAEDGHGDDGDGADGGGGDGGGDDGEDDDDDDGEPPIHVDLTALELQREAEDEDDEDGEDFEV